MPSTETISIVYSDLETISLNELAKAKDYTRFPLAQLEENVEAINTNLRGLNKLIGVCENRIADLKDTINQKQAEFNAKKDQQEAIETNIAALAKSLIKIPQEIEALNQEAAELAKEKQILEKSLKAKGILQLVQNRFRNAENDPLPSATKKDIQEKIASNKKTSDNLMTLIEKKKELSKQTSDESANEEALLNKKKIECKALTEELTELDARRATVRGKLNKAVEEHEEYTLCLEKITIFIWLHKIDAEVSQIIEKLAAQTKTTTNDALHDAKVKKGLDALQGYLHSDTTDDALHKTILYPIQKISNLERMIITIEAVANTNNLNQLCKNALAAINDLSKDDAFGQECIQIVNQAAEKLVVSNNLVTALTQQIRVESLHILTTVQETIAKGVAALAEEKQALNREIEKAIAKKTALVKELAQNNSALSAELNAKQTKKANAIIEKLTQLHTQSNIFINKTNRLIQEGYLFNNARNKSYGLSQLCTNAINVNLWAKGTKQALNASPLTIDKNEIMKCKDALQKEEARLNAIRQPRVDMQKRYFELLDKYMSYRRKNFRRHDRFFSKKAEERKKCVNDLKLALKTYAKADEHADPTPIKQVINANKSKFKFGFFALHFAKKQPPEKSLYYLLKSLEEELAPAPRKAPHAGIRK